MKATSREDTLSLFLQMGRGFKARMERAMPLPFAQCEMLAFIAEHPSPTMRDLSQHFKITAPSATSMVEGLVRGKCVRRVRDAHDRRSVRLSLTPAGARAASAIGKSRKKVLGGIIRGLAPGDRRDLHRILERIVKDL